MPRGGCSSGDSDPQQYPDRAEPVAPRDLLALLVRATVIGDRQLVDPELALADLGRDLRLDPELVLAQVERAQHLRTKSLVAGLHVGERRVVEDAREQRE